MPVLISFYQRGIIIGVAVPAPMSAGIVSADIHAGGAAAEGPLVPVPDIRDRAAARTLRVTADPFQPGSVDAAGCSDSQRAKRRGFRAGLKTQSIGNRR